MQGGSTAREARKITTGMSALTCLIDGFGPLPTSRPSSVQELGDIIQQARSANTALYPFGGQTKLALGIPPTKQGQAVDLRGLSSIIEYPARDMTVTVQAGITMKTLQDTLLKENLRLPIDVAQADQATLGGIVATNTSGPRRFGYGTLRDYVIGITALNTDGNQFKAGGRVVKNVAGYDICKLLVGSLGTLGIITQVTLKLRPVAEEQALICIPCESANLDSLLTTLHNSRTRPVCIDLLNQPASHQVFAHAHLAVPETAWTLIVGYEGNADAVNWQMQQLVKEIGTRDQFDARLSFTAQPLWDALIAWGDGQRERTIFKANMLPSSASAFCLHVDRDPHRPALRAHAGNGIVFGCWNSTASALEMADILADWRKAAQKGQGSVIVTRCEPGWKSSLSVWGPSPADAWLMREVKAKFDPLGIFNPGRFLDGI